MSTQHAQRSVFSVRCNAFTLVELLVSMLIISILAGLVMFAMNSAMESVKITRTRSMILKIDRVIRQLWDESESRRLPIVISAGTPAEAAYQRAGAVWERQRLELPERLTDVQDPPNGLFPLPLVTQAYQRAAENGTKYLQTAEFLYLILKMASDEDGSAIDRFSPKYIGDQDADGMPEIWDAWGTPIRFLRWAPGFQGIDPQIDPSNPEIPPLYPLVVSAGADRKFDIAFYVDAEPIHYSQQSSPYTTHGDDEVQMGQPVDADNDGRDDLDNIHNHSISTRLRQ